MKKIENILTIVLFFAFILGGLVSFIILPDKVFSENENRYLKECPTPKLASITDGSFMEDWDEYMSDQFVARDDFMLMGNGYKFALGMRDFNGVFIGKDGYLINVMNPNGLDEERIHKNIKNINRFISNSECKVSFMLVPDASMLLNDKLPKGIGMEWEWQLLKDIRSSINGAVIVEPEKSMNNSNEQLYYYTDHHWTGYGAYMAYEEYCKTTEIKTYDAELEVITDEFYGSLYSKVLYAPIADEIVIDKSKKDIEIIADGKAKTLYDYSSLNQKDKYLVFQGGNYGVTEIPGTGEGVILVIKDSFANSFVPYLTDNYEKIIMLDMRYYMGSPKALIDRFGVTDVLILYSVSNFVTDENMIKLGL